MFWEENDLEMLDWKALATLSGASAGVHTFVQMVKRCTGIKGRCVHWVALGAAFVVCLTVSWTKGDRYGKSLSLALFNTPIVAASACGIHEHLGRRRRA